MRKLIELLKYPSTWKGLITLVTILGVKVAPEQAEAIATAGIATVGAIATFFSDADVKTAAK